MKPKIPELRAHVKTLCKRAKVKLRTHSGTYRQDRCFLDTRIIELRPIRTRAIYAIALHEIGHFESKTLYHPKLFQEGAAWHWARRNALCWDASMERTRVKGLLSYLEQALVDYGRNHPNLLRLPPPKHPFWEPLLHLPEVSTLLASKRPEWLSNEHTAVPWGNILSHPERPRCENCAFWRHLASYNRADTSSKLSLGECCHKLRPLGVETTPGGALCGNSWIRRD